MSDVYIYSNFSEIYDGVCAVWAYTSEDIKALIVGPILVLMLICFSSSAHIVRHLRRVSGSFWGKKDNKNVNFYSVRKIY